MRGKPTQNAELRPLLGITPADAGKTMGCGVAIKAEGDHPRGCGENIDPRALTYTTRGSPPRMRGKRLIWYNKCAINRITPADAGKTAWGGAVPRRCKDHPRGCGENRKPDMVIHPYQGSPPRMRGKLAIRK